MLMSFLVVPRGGVFSWSVQCRFINGEIRIEFHYGQKYHDGCLRSSAALAHQDIGHRLPCDLLLLLWSQDGEPLS